MNICIPVTTNSFELVKSSIKDDIKCIDRPGLYNRPPLYYCIAYSDKKMLMLLLSFHPNLFQRDDFGLSIFDYAYYYDCQNGYHFLNILLDFVKNNNLNDKFSINYKENIENVIQKYGNLFLDSLHILHFDSDDD